MPISAITAGTNRQRTIVASIAIATDRPTPNCLMIASSVRMKLENTQTMISAAEVITRPVDARPSITACLRVADSLKCSWICVSRNTS